VCFMRIGLLTTTAYSNYLHALIKSLWRALEFCDCSLDIVEGYSLMNNSVSDYQCNVVYRLVSQGRIDALIISGQLASRAGVELVQDLAAKAGIPVVSYGIELEGVPSVITDNFSGFEQIVSHLVSHGYRKMAHISGPLKNPEALIRRDAFLKVIYQNGLEVPKQFMLEGNFTDVAGYNLTKKLIPHIKLKEIDAIVCANDETAIGAIKCLEDSGINVPRDVAVTGFDDAAASLGIVNTLTTVAQPFEEMSQKAVELLMDKRKYSAVSQVYTFEPSLVIRNSCGCRAVRYAGEASYSGPIFSPLRTHGRFASLDEVTFYSTLTDCLADYGMNSCYIVRFLSPTRFDDYASSGQSLKGTLLYGFSHGTRIQYAKSFDVSKVLPDAFFNTLDGITLVKLVFIGKNQLGYIVMSAPENMTRFMADLCIDVQQYMENALLAHEKQLVEKKLSDTLERLVNTNRKLNELTVRDNLDKMKKIRFLANKMLQNRDISSGEYYLIIVEINNFYEINAQYGFKESEFIMNSVSEILAGCIRDDDFLSHQSCERYVVLIKNVQGDVIKSIGERFMNSLNEFNSSHGKPYTISISWGYCHAGMDSDFEKVYLEAEADLSRKKQAMETS